MNTLRNLLFELRDALLTPLLHQWSLRQNIDSYIKEGQCADAEGAVTLQARKAAEDCRKGLAHDQVSASKQRVQRLAISSAQAYIVRLKRKQIDQHPPLALLGEQRIQAIFQKTFQAEFDQKEKGQEPRRKRGVR